RARSTRPRRRIRGAEVVPVGGAGGRARGGRAVLRPPGRGFPRMRLINVVTLFFAACPVVFYLLATVHVRLGVIFFVWIGVFSLMVVAQFWSFANDIYTK